MRENIIETKSFSFAIRVVKLHKYLTENKKEYILSKQLLRSGTSIGANVTESQNAQSNLDFINKMSIALKETSETKYWIRLLNATDYLTEEESKSIMADCIEIENILVKIIKTSKEKTRGEELSTTLTRGPPLFEERYTIEITLFFHLKLIV